MVAALPRIWRYRSDNDPLGGAAWREMVNHAGYFTWGRGRLEGRRARRPWRSRRLFRGAVPELRYGMSWTSNPAVAEHFARCRQSPSRAMDGRVWVGVFEPGRLLAYLRDEREYLVDAHGVDILEATPREGGMRGPARP